MNRNKLLDPGSDYFYQDATGMKTGFTSQAGYCLVSSAERGGRQLIAVVLNAGQGNCLERFYFAAKLWI